MSYSDDHIALAAEYALGTLDADERALVETMMSVDHGFKGMVEAWDQKLAPLYQMVAPIEPPAHVWEKIKAEAGLSGDQAPIVLPSARDEEIIPDRHIEPTRHIEPIRYRESILPGPNAAKKSERKSSAGYAFGMVMSALAASLAAVVTLQAYRPELLPAPLRVKPKVQVVEIHAPAPPSSAQLVAVLQQGAAEPAFILTVDPVTKNFTVRKVGAAPEAGKSFELWIVSDKLQRPRSLGVIGSSDFTKRPALASYDTDTINQATYAVTVEPEGGSPSGNPTTNPIYAGKLIESVPAGDR